MQATTCAPCGSSGWLSRGRCAPRALGMSASSGPAWGALPRFHNAASPRGMLLRRDLARHLVTLPNHCGGVWVGTAALVGEHGTPSADWHPVVGKPAPIPPAKNHDPSGPQCCRRGSAQQTGLSDADIPRPRGAQRSRERKGRRNRRGRTSLLATSCGPKVTTRGGVSLGLRSGLTAPNARTPCRPRPE